MHAPDKVTLSRFVGEYIYIDGKYYMFKCKTNDDADYDVDTVLLASGCSGAITSSSSSRSSGSSSVSSLSSSSHSSSSSN